MRSTRKALLYHCFVHQLYDRFNTFLLHFPQDNEEEAAQLLVTCWKTSVRYKCLLTSHDVFASCPMLCRFASHIFLFFNSILPLSITIDLSFLEPFYKRLLSLLILLIRYTWYSPLIHRMHAYSSQICSDLLKLSSTVNTLSSQLWPFFGCWVEDGLSFIIWPHSKWTLFALVFSWIIWCQSVQDKVFPCMK